MTSIKKSILTSLLSLLLCSSLLVSGSFAWFSTQITNKENKITASTINSNAYFYANTQTPQDGGSSVTVEGKTFYFPKAGQVLNEHSFINIDTNLLNSEEMNACLVEVKNEGSMAFKYRFKVSQIVDRGLADVIWFDFIKVNQGNATIDRTKHLSEIDEIINNQSSQLESKSSTQYLLIYGVDESKKQSFINYYKDNSFSFDLKMESISIDDEFVELPKDRVFNDPITNTNDLLKMMEYINNGNQVESTINQSVSLENTITISENQIVKLNIPEGIKFDIPNQVKNQSGFDNSSNNESYTKKSAITVQKGGTLELSGKGTLTSDDYYGIYVEEGGTLKVEGVNFEIKNGYKSGIYGIYSKGTLVFENSHLTVETDNEILTQSDNPSPLGGSTAYGIYAAGGTLKVDQSQIKVTGATNNNTGNGANGIYVNGATDVSIVNTQITGTGEGISQTGICCFSGKISLISEVTLDIKGTAIDTWEPIGSITKSVLKGTEYSLYNRSGTPINVIDCQLPNKIIGQSDNQ